MEVSFGKRQIKDGKAYDHLFPKPDKLNTVFGNNPTIRNVQKVIPWVVENFKHEARGIADELYSEDTEQFAKNIWEFLFNYIQYEYDEYKKEQFRSPARSWANRKRGIDCDCFSVFASCILSNKNVNHCIRITSYGNDPRWQHIYVIVPKPGIVFNPHNSSTYYVIDAVLYRFNYEKDYSQQKTFNMNKGLGIVTEVLHGVDEDDVDIVSDILNGVEGLSGNNLNSIYKLLVKTRDWIVNNPQLVKEQGDDPHALLEMYEYAIKNFWKGEETRNKAFEILAKAEAKFNRKILGFTEEDIEDLSGWEDDIDNMVDDDDVYDFDAVDNHVDDQIEGLGRLSKAERKKRREEQKKARKAKRKKKKSTRQAVRKERKQERKKNKADRKKERKEAKGFFRKVGVALKQGGRAVAVKANPAVIAARTGFLAVIRLNMFRITSRIKYAYLPESQAKKDGKNYQAAVAMRKKVEEIFADKLGGKRTALKKAVLLSNTSLKGIDEQDWESIALEFSGIDSGLSGAASMAAVISAVPVIVKVINAIAEVEDQYGVEGFGSIEDDYDDVIMCLDGLDGGLEGLNGLNGEKVTADVVIAWIKKFFGKLKEKRTERQVDKKSMSKKEYKALRKKSRKMKQAERQQAKANKTTFNQLKTKAGAFVQNMEKSKESNEGSAPSTRTNDLDAEFTEDITKVSHPEDNNTNTGNKKKLWMILGGLGIATIAGGIVISNNKKKQKALNGIPEKSQIKKVTIK